MALMFQFGLGGHLTTQGCATREINAALHINLDDHHRNLIAKGNNILWTHDLIISKLRCANQPLFTGQNLDETAEIDDTANRTRVDVANLNFLSQSTYRIHGLLHSFT